MGASLGQEAMGEIFIHGEIRGTAWQPNKCMPELLLMVYTHEDMAYIWHRFRNGVQWIKKMYCLNKMFLIKDWKMDLFCKKCCRVCICLLGRWKQHLYERVKDTDRERRGTEEAVWGQIFHYGREKHICGFGHWASLLLLQKKKKTLWSMERRRVNSVSCRETHTHTVRLLRTHTRPTHTPTDTHRWNRDRVWHLKGKSWHWVHHCHCACHKAAANIKTFFICAALLAPEIVFLSVWYSPELRRRSLETAGCYQGLPTYWQLMVVFMYTCHSRVFNIPTLLMLPKIPVFTLRMAMLLTQKQQFSSFCEICQYEQKFLLMYTDMCIKPIHIFDPVVHFDLFMPPPLHIAWPTKCLIKIIFSFSIVFFFSSPDCDRLVSSSYLWHTCLLFCLHININ